MRRRRVTQARLAEVMGVSQGMISRWFAREAVSQPLKEKIEAYIREQAQPAEQSEQVGAL
jgi:transcriptional regulator with XRE-family HTH domain